MISTLHKLLNSGYRCPICQSRSFGDMNGRQKARCLNCGSLERTRLMWLVIQNHNMLSNVNSILHIAPEKCLYDIFSNLNNVEYRPCDLYPSLYDYKNPIVEMIDLCGNLDCHFNKKFDLIVHNHVLEHVKCDYIYVIKKLNSLLSESGYHIFSIPFRGDLTDEHIEDDLSEHDRISRFGQVDHVRIFGRHSFHNDCSIHFPEYIADRTLSNFLSPRILRKCRIPTSVISDPYTSHSIMVLSTSTKH